MKKILLIILVLMILYILMRRPSSSSSGYGEKSLHNQFISTCPPGQMPASYTKAGGDCVPYYF
jgi:hypothetical protein